MKTNPAVIIQDLTVVYYEKPVLWRINAAIPHGVMMAIVGPNGAGKSTLLKTSLNLIKPSTGSIKFFDQQNTRMLKRVAYVPQRSLIDWTFPITVFDVVLMGTYASLGWFRRPGNKEHQQVHAALASVHMEAYAHTPICELSGGQQQRILLARSLVQQADLYLLDEPFVGIDAPTELLIIALMQSLRDQGKTIIAVHHDLQSIDAHFDWMMLLNVHCIAYGERTTVFTDDNLAKTYKKYNVFRTVEKV